MATMINNGLEHLTEKKAETLQRGKEKAQRLKDDLINVDKYLGSRVKKIKDGSVVLTKRTRSSKHKMSTRNSVHSYAKIHLFIFIFFNYESGQIL